MELKAHFHRLENIKAIHDLHSAGLDHHVIAVFLTAEGISMTTQEVSSIVNTYDALGKVKLPSKKVQALINAKKLGQNDENLPCPV
ncbi:hypothetical protein MWMV2_MWMV2_01743 [Acinetobacter oleivorans]|uniref:hypothetical protein n=1 Tax=Acinetobacter oleivorans TaxID=1148157 RepID=UPI00125ED810|nr:hypothetical protein [Acinetobacter oleivorans]CAI3129946.1 hypothetical protein MWMV19_MWMV19_01502 [Acinetobacter oleivorans]CAI3133282.1 hypothetical protein MWMV3_MWMV3_01743 [Acinetobacter oleivorans]CAI3133866.1 hypothetical protein MWMV5_MWMV5_01743 [Acinetobacter oleivorans]CAI3133882.1 hypothetical protein MWMV2_MWMV2_01743 [Acinetobacter oleivorans]CAI3133892.1 hypothetical protein MWMV13_MWMV13_01743 [Acinetobacter oleivorans]